jgi:hypothetical protein
LRRACLCRAFFGLGEVEIDGGRHGCFL